MYILIRPCCCVPVYTLVFYNEGQNLNAASDESQHVNFLFFPQPN